VTVTELEPHGDQVSVRTADLSADITVAAVADLGLAPQTAVTFAVKASEVAIYRTCRVRTGPGGWCDPVTSSRLCPSDLPRK
jgi:hypothetical protein